MQVNYNCLLAKWLGASSLWLQLLQLGHLPFLCTDLAGVPRMMGPSFLVFQSICSKVRRRTAPELVQARRKVSGWSLAWSLRGPTEILQRSEGHLSIWPIPWTNVLAVHSSRVLILQSCKRFFQTLLVVLHSVTVP